MDTNRIVLIIAIYLVVINLVAFIFYGVDKRKAQRNKWRIKESTLLWLAALGGGLGAWHGMKKFHHKTKHKKFTILVPLFFFFGSALWDTWFSSIFCFRREISKVRFWLLL